MDLYSTRVLAGLVNRIRPLPTFFLTTFFPQAIYHTTEEVYFDVAEDKPRIAPFVHPMREGKLIESLGYSTKNLKPAYVKDKRVHDTEKAIKRMAGEPINGEMTEEQRLQTILVQDLADQRKMLTRRFEIMAAEAIIDGKQTIIGDGFNAVVDFGRDAALDITLTGADVWDYATVPDMTAQFEEWDALLSDKCGSNTSHVIMDSKAWKLFRKNPDLKEKLDNRRGTDAITIDITAMLQMEGIKFKGMYGEFPIFVYNHKYVDPVDGQTKQVMPDNTVVFVAKAALQGVRHFGAIRDLKAGLRSMEMFTKSWEQEDPSVRFLLMQSAPIFVPYVTNATLKVTVT